MKYELLRKDLVLGIIMLFVGAGIQPSLGGNIVDENPIKTISDCNILYVGGSGEGNYTSIQDAIIDSVDGDIVYVYNDSSPYYENIIIEKSINLIGEDRNTTVINGIGGGDVVRVSVDLVKINGFTIKNNTYFFGCRTGICLSYCITNIITNNIITSNKMGIHLEESSNNIITGNIFISNIIGISPNGSFDNTIYHNNFINNSQNAFDYGYNIWDNGQSGNYWDDYIGEDNDGDGIGDTSYTNHGVEDRYPLMEPWDGGNQPPQKPIINGPLIKGKPGIEYSYTFVTTDPDGDYVWYVIDWGDGINSSWLGPFSSGEDIKVKHIWDKNGTFTIKVKAKDVYGAESEWGYLEVDIFEFENQPPNKPSITGPISGNVGKEYEYIFNVIDLDDDDVFYYIDWGDGINSSWLGPFSSGEDIKVKHIWDKNGTFTIKVKAKDVYGAESEWGYLEVDIFEFENQPPNTPIIDGLNRGNTNTEYDFTFNATDPDGDDVRYFINWGDSTSEWTGYNHSGTAITVKHKFSERRYYTIIAKAQDIYGSESTVGSLAIYIPRSKPFNFNLFVWLFERFPNLFIILRYILRF